jgi:hypothetical protein
LIPIEGTMFEFCLGHSPYLLNDLEGFDTH